MGRWLTEKYRAAHPGRWREIRDTVAACTPTGYIGCAQAIGNFNYTARLKAVKLPVLVACGTDDPRAAPGETRHIASLFPDGRYEEFAGARHLPNVEYPEAFNRMLLDWLKAKG